MAQRYGKLPTEILSKATTTDLMIMDLTDSYLNYKQTIAKTGLPPTPKYTTEQLQDILNKAKARRK